MALRRLAVPDISCPHTKVGEPRGGSAERVSSNTELQRWVRRGVAARGVERTSCGDTVSQAGGRRQRVGQSRKRNVAAIRRGALGRRQRIGTIFTSALVLPAPAMVARRHHQDPDVLVVRAQAARVQKVTRCEQETHGHDCVLLDTAARGSSAQAAGTHNVTGGGASTQAVGAARGLRLGTKRGDGGSTSSKDCSTAHPSHHKQNAVDEGSDGEGAEGGSHAEVVLRKKEKWCTYWPWISPQIVTGPCTLTILGSELSSLVACSSAPSRGGHLRGAVCVDERGDLEQQSRPYSPRFEPSRREAS
ncbi:hypothetical protein DFH08DRAFT_817541 [Mycena albidolilacea]|uniref:Uncharacterized protein n=1 Tax=Mycena albidolilacea TaxID=1033008 RepID=A0AAD6ZIX7_9AGAR|nr:hypothetical protein DFH08DRAFT_817541 [Mycena albidolilacea]